MALLRSPLRAKSLDDRIRRLPATVKEVKEQKLHGRDAAMITQVRSLSMEQRVIVSQLHRLTGVFFEQIG